MYSGPRLSRILDIHVGENHGFARLDRDRLAVFAALIQPTRLLMPDVQAELAGGGVLDLELAARVGDGEVRVVEDANPGSHPGVGVALNPHKERRRLAAP